MTASDLIWILSLSGGLYVLYLSPFIARDYGIRAARRSRLLLVAMLNLIAYALFLLVVGGLFFLFFYSLIVSAFFSDGPILFVMVPLGITLAVLEIILVGAFLLALPQSRRPLHDKV